MKIIVKPEGRPDVWLPEKESLKEWIKSKNFDYIHNFVGGGAMFLGADHEVESVLSDLDRAERLAVFTDPLQNIGHSLAMIIDNKLEMFDVGKITMDDLEVQDD